MLQKKYNVYHNLGYWFLSLIVLVFAGFYRTYFSIIFQPAPLVIHVHFLLMAMWIAMLITQPFLIKYKKLALHRLIGKISYVLVPLALLSSFLVIRLSYYRYINELHEQVAKGLESYTTSEILKQASDDPIAIFNFSWFALFYILAIINKHKSAIHARYMLATALTLLGPTVDRIVTINFKIEHIYGSISSYIVSFLITDLVLAILLVHDYRNKKPIKTLANCIAIYVIGQVLYFIVPTFSWWPYFVQFIMKPSP